MRSAQLRAYQRTATYRRALLREVVIGLRIAAVGSCIVLVLLHYV